MAKRFKYYDIKETLRAYPNAYYYVVFGERSNGKTYSALAYALERFFKTGEQFAYIRRYGEDIRPKNLTTLFAGHIENGMIDALSRGEWSSVDYSRQKFYPVSTKDGERLVGDTPIGYAFDLNAMEHYKSTSYPKVTTIIFDEFMSRSGYLPNEWLLFINTVSTIVRHRNNIKIILLGNTVNKVCPYFEEMGLNHIKDQKPGTVDVYEYGDSGLQVVCEYTESTAKRGGKDSDVYFAFDNPELKMITSGAWEIAVYPHLNVKLVPKDTIANFFIEYSQELLHGEVICRDDLGTFIFIHGKTSPIKDEENDIVYSDKSYERWNYRLGLTHHDDKLSRFIVKCLREGKVFYSTNEVGEVVRNFVIFSDTYNIKN